MKNTSSEETKLLEKLYNLRGKDSYIFANINEEKEKAEKTKSRTESEKKTLEENINKLNSEERLLADQGEKLKNLLKNIKKDDFNVLLEKLNIDFDPEDLNKKITDGLPETIETVANEKKNDETKLVEIEKEMESAITLIEELSLRKDQAVSNQNKLNEYFKLALNGNINVTRDSITNLLGKFAFNDDEQREAAKLLMFPEDYLFDYDKSLENEPNDNSNNEKPISIKEIIQEPKDNIISESKDLSSVNDLIKKTLNNEKEEIKEEINEEPILKRVTPEIIIPQKEDNENQEIKPLEKAKEEKLDSSFDARDYLKEKGFNSDKLSESDIKEINKNHNIEIMNNNIDYLNKIGLNKDLLIDNIEFLNDNDLKDKIEKLLEIGKTPFDIYLNPNILNKYNLNELTKVINDLKESGLDPQKVPLMAF
jgi:hypothetical protein